MDAVADATLMGFYNTPGICLPADRIFAPRGGLEEEHSFTLEETSSVANDQSQRDFHIKMSDENEVDGPLYCGQYDEEYRFSNPMRAKVVVFNHFAFDEQRLHPRSGTDMDVKALRKTLPQLGFSFEDEDFVVNGDLTSLEIQIELSALSEVDFSKYDCLMIFVLTHGDNKDRLWARDKPYNNKNLWENFAADKCPTLAGKPKLFFIEASRGDQFCKTVKLASYESSVKDQEGVYSFSKSNFSASRLNVIPFERKKATYNMPVIADFLQVYSTAEGQVSFRDVERGSWFIQALCANLLHFSPHLDILKIITRTALEVAVGPQFETTVKLRDEEFIDSRGNLEKLGVQRRTRQMPSFCSTLTRDLYFRPSRPSTVPH